MRTKLILSVMFLVMTSLSFANESLGTVNGQVVSHDNEGIAQAKVVLFDVNGVRIDSIQTDENGNYMLSPKEYGVYTIKVTTKGEICQERKIVIFEAKTKIGNIVMCKNSNRTGINKEG